MDFDYSVHAEAILANFHTRMVLPSKTLLFFTQNFLLVVFTSIEFHRKEDLLLVSQELFHAIYEGNR